MNRIVASTFLSLYMVTASGDALDWLRRFGATSATDAARPGSLSDSEIARGLYQAPRQGLQQADAQLRQPGGFLDDSRVRIPLPDSLARIESALRAAGAERYANEFVATMNHAAEQAGGQARFRRQYAGQRQPGYRSLRDAKDPRRLVCHGRRRRKTYSPGSGGTQHGIAA